MKFKNYVLLYCLTCLGLVVSVIGYDWYEGSNFDSQWHSLGLYSLVVSFVLTSLYFGYDLWQQKRQAAEIKLLNDKLVDLLKEGAYHHVILKPSDPHYELAQSINAIQSKQKRFVKNFVRQQRGYFSLLEYLTSGVMLIDQDNLIYTANHALNEIFAKDLNQKQSPYYYVLDNFELIQLIEQAIRTKSDQAKEIKHHQDGEKLLAVQVRYIPLSKHHFLIMCLVDDVTQKRKLEQQQKDFLANLSHELKTPITSISGFSETLLTGALSDQTVSRQFVEIIHRESKELAELIEDGLSLARIEDDRALNLTSFNLYAFCNASLDSFTKLIFEKQIKVKLEVEPALEIVCDQRKLRHILNNLLQNGLRYNRPEGKLTIKANLLANEWQLIVSDTGIGIEKAEQKRIFERFYRVDQSRTKAIAGTGLGLAVVKEYVELLSGDISLVSKPNEGSTFTVTLPRFEL